MKNIISFSIVVGLVVNLTACDPSEQFKEELAEIDSLEVFVEDFEGKYESIEFDSLKLMVEEVEQNERDIKSFYSPDTINEELGKQMLECKSIRKKLSGSDAKKMTFGDELNAIKHQLINLRSDIENGLLNEEDIRRYIDVDWFEKEKKELFSDVPLVVGFSSMLKNPGDFFTFDLAGAPMILVRSKDRKVHCFLNVCRHRGVRLTNSPNVSNTKTFFCITVFA